MAEKCSECNEGCMMQLDKNIRQCNACTSRYVKIESSTPDQEKPHPLDNVLNDLFDTSTDPRVGTATLLQKVAQVVSYAECTDDFSRGLLREALMETAEILVAMLKCVTSANIRDMVVDMFNNRDANFHLSRCTAGNLVYNVGTISLYKISVSENKNFADTLIGTYTGAIRTAVVWIAHLDGDL